MEDLFMIRNILIAVLLGSLIGLERERGLQKPDRQGFAGIRTFTLMSFLGAITYMVARSNTVVFLGLSIGFILFIIATYVMGAIYQKRLGATTDLASIITFMVGVFAARGEIIISVVVSILVLITLTLKKPLHEFAKKIEKKELYSTIKFLIIAFIVLPLLPNETFGPFDVLNPYLIWLMVVFVTGISFLSYILIKFIGSRKGVGMIGFLGGLASSTAVTMSLAGKSTETKGSQMPFVFAIVIASAGMFFRVLIEAFVLNRQLFYSLLLPMLSMGFVGALCGVFVWKKKERLKEDVGFENPFRIIPAIKFAVFFAAILFVSKAMLVYFGTKGIYLTSFFSGLADIDAITLSMAKLSGGDLSTRIATKAITIASISNTLTKATIVSFFASNTVRKEVVLIMSMIMITGLVLVFFI